MGYHAETFSAAGTTYHAYFWYPSGAAAADLSDPYGVGFASRLAVNGAVAGSNLPVIVFAHGDSGCATQSLFITESLAAHGYVVAALNYRDAGTSCPDGQGASNSPPFGDPDAWNASTYVYRRDDTKALIGQLAAMNAAAGNFLQGRLDMNRLGYMGHSLGGYAGAALAEATGPWSTWYEPRIRASLLLSPYINPFNLVANKPWTALQPIMLQGGTEDVAITPFLGAFYSYLQQRRYFLTFDQSAMTRGTGHFAWTNSLCQPYRQQADATAACLAGVPQAAAIVHYGASFLDAYVAGTAASVDTTSSAAVTSYQSCPAMAC